MVGLMEHGAEIERSTERAFRTRIVLATLSGTSLTINNIRPQGFPPGLKDYEVEFLKIIQLATNGSHVEIDRTGTRINYRPGIIYGGEMQYCISSPNKAIGYYLEMIVPLALFSKHPFQLTLRGVTNNSTDPSVDSIRMLVVGLFRMLRIDESRFELRVVKRGFGPLGGGCVYFSCPTVRNVLPIKLSDPGKIKCIRGIAFCARTSPQLPNRLAEASRRMFSEYVSDVRIYTEVAKRTESGNSPGYGLVLEAESTTGTTLVSEGLGVPDQCAEDMARDVGSRLLLKIKTSGCMDSRFQWVYLLLMGLSSEGVSTLKMDKLTRFTADFLRELKMFFGIVFKLGEREESVMASCIGIGFINYNARSN